MSCSLCYEDNELVENGYYHHCVECEKKLKDPSRNWRQTPWCGIWASTEKLHQREVWEITAHAKALGIHCEGCNCESI